MTGFKSQSYLSDYIDENRKDSLPQQEDENIEKKIAPLIKEQMKDITFDHEDENIKVYNQAVSI